jgi:methyl-galactoside transport system substrate-binding protein
MGAIDGGLTKFRMLSLGAAFLLAGSVLTGCGGGEERESVKRQAKPLIGALFYHKDPYINLVAQHLEKFLDGQVNLVARDAGQDQFVQNEQFTGMLDDKIVGALINIVEIQRASEILDKSKKAGIPVIFFNREPDPAVFRGYDRARFVGTVAKDAGILQGDLIKKLWDAHPEYDRNGDGKIQYLMFQAGPDNPEAVARTEYSIRRAVELGLNMQQLGETYMCNWDEKWAHDTMKTAFLRFGDKVELIVANNDAMALGVASALNEFGFNLPDGDRKKFIPIIGVDATPQAIEAIDKGLLSATVRQDAEGMAKALADMILNAVNGKEFLDGTGLKYDRSGIAVRIPYAPYTAR